MAEDEMVGQHHGLDGHEFEQAPGIGDGQGSLAFCSPWGHKELDTTKQARKQQLELNIEQQTGSKQEKDYVKAVYCHPAYLKKLNVMNFCDVDTCNI